MDITLSNGIKMPINGLGTSGASSNALISAVKTSIQSGNRLIDTAAAYDNEECIEEAIAECISEGIVKREDLFIVTKCPRSGLHPSNQEAAIKESLKELRLDYIDLYLAHNPCAMEADTTVEEIWKGLEVLYERKLARAIGLSNFNVQQIERILKVSKVPIHCHQIELHLYFQQKDMSDFCRGHGITVMAYAPLGSPNRKIYAVAGKDDSTPKHTVPLEDPLVLELAQKHHKTPAQILLRHLIQAGYCVIPKSTNATRIKENLNIFDFELCHDEMERLNHAPQHPRTFWLDFQCGHPEDSFKDERKNNK